VDKQSEHDTFDPSFFAYLKKAEKNHFWFHVRRRWIFDRISKIMPPPARLLEVGCGTGNVSSYLSSKGYTVTGCEYFSQALDMAWPGFEKVRADARNLPFEDDTFEIAGLFDVIEHFEYPALPLSEAKRILKKGGIVSVTVPARKELWSYFDESARHKRRFEKEELRDTFRDVGLTPLLVQYMFMTLYLPMKKYRSEKKGDQDLFIVNPILNLLLKGVFHGERLFSGLRELPLGTSIIAIAQKT
jgi:SAM-dependent methyltransferase